MSAPPSLSTRRPLRYLALFLAPLAVIVTVAGVVLYFSNEFYTTPAGLREQVRTDGLYGRSVFADEFRYKTLLWEHHQPVVYALGSSRTLQFRAASFRPETRFMTAGRAMNSLAEGITFLDYARRSSHAPRTVLLALDPWWFNPNFVSPGVVRDPEQYDSLLYLFRSAIGNLGKLAARLDWSGRRLDPVSGRVAIGSRARRFGEGFLVDGSYQYAPAPPGRSVESIRRTVLEVREGRERWPFAGHADRSALAKLDQMQKRAAAAGTRLVILLPPLPEEVVTALESDPRHAWFAEYRRQTRAWAADRAIPFYDFCLLTGTGAGDFIDGLHAGAALHDRMLGGISELAGDLIGGGRPAQP